MEVVLANSYLRQVLDLDSRRILTGNGNEGNIWAKNASFHRQLVMLGNMFLHKVRIDFIILNPNWQKTTFECPKHYHKMIAIFIPQKQTWIMQSRPGRWLDWSNPKRVSTNVFNLIKMNLEQGWRGWPCGQVIIWISCNISPSALVVWSHFNEAARFVSPNSTPINHTNLAHKPNKSSIFSPHILYIYKSHKAHKMYAIVKQILHNNQIAQ